MKLKWRAIAALRGHLTKCSKYERPVTTLEDVVKFINCCYMSLVVDIAEEKLEDRKWIIVSCANHTFSYIKSGPVKPAKITFHPEGHMTFDVLGHIIYHGDWKSSDSTVLFTVTTKLDTLLPNSGYLYFVLEYQPILTIMDFP